MKSLNLAKVKEEYTMTPEKERQLTDRKRLEAYSTTFINVTYMTLLQAVPFALRAIGWKSVNAHDETMIAREAIRETRIVSYKAWYDTRKKTHRVALAVKDAVAVAQAFNIELTDMKVEQMFKAVDIYYKDLEAEITAKGEAIPVNRRFPGNTHRENLLAVFTRTKTNHNAQDLAIRLLELGYDGTDIFYYVAGIRGIGRKEFWDTYRSF